MSETKLLPCVFCGGTRASVSGGWVDCEDCQAEGPFIAASEGQREAAITAWNTRTPDPRIAAADAMAKALEAFVEAWDKSHQLEKTDVARGMAETALAAYNALK